MKQNPYKQLFPEPLPGGNAREALAEMKREAPVEKDEDEKRSEEEG